MNIFFPESQLIIVNNLTADEMLSIRGAPSDVLVSLSPVIPTQFYLLPSMQLAVEQQSRAQESLLKALGKKLSIPPSQQFMVKNQLLGNNLLNLACEHQCNVILIPKKWSALKYLAWWYKRKGVEIKFIANKNDITVVSNGMIRVAA
jgi:hypothetical protein